MKEKYLNSILEKVHRNIDRNECRDCIKLINKEYRTMIKDKFKIRRKD